MRQSVSLSVEDVVIVYQAVATFLVSQNIDVLESEERSLAVLIGIFADIYKKYFNFLSEIYKKYFNFLSEATRSNPFQYIIYYFP